MIISEIIGGLGNQMFQYAAGWSLARQKNTIFKLDVSAYVNYPLHHGFEIAKVFQAKSDIASSSDMSRVLGWQSGKFAKRLFLRPNLAPLRKSSMIVEPHFHYFNVLSQSPENAYLRGYWQSEKYFDSCAVDIRKQFQFSLTLGPENEAWKKIIREKNSVSVHIRRGDFVSKNNAAIHGACSPSYYASAISRMLELTRDTVFFIFSDDVPWARANLNVGRPCFFVENNTGANSFNDMHLMSLCQHNIIANSSFSWWGAWLNPNLNKLIIAPKQWFASGLETPDLLPSAWITL